MYTYLKIDKISLYTYSHMKRRTSPGKGWCRRKCKYFRMHIRKYNRAFGKGRPSQKGILQELTLPRL